MGNLRHPGDSRSQLLHTPVSPRTGERDGLLIALLFDGCLRVSEAIRLRPRDLAKTAQTAQVALSASLEANWQSYA